MSNRPKTKSKIQYGDSPTQPAGAKGGAKPSGGIGHGIRVVVYDRRRLGGG